MEMQALKYKAGILLRLAYNGQEHGNLNSELVLGLSGGYVGVCVGIDIRIYTQGYVGSLAQCGATLGNYVQFSL